MGRVADPGIFVAAAVSWVFLPLSILPYSTCLSCHACFTVTLADKAAKPCPGMAQGARGGHKLGQMTLDTQYSSSRL